MTFVKAERHKKQHVVFQLNSLILTRTPSVFSSPFQLHFAALASLKSEINDLNKKLKKVTAERDSYKLSLKESKEEKERLVLKYEERLHEQDQQGEQQVTELQSVIAELRRKLDQASVNCIAEEDEEEEGTRSSDDRGNCK